MTQSTSVKTPSNDRRRRVRTARALVLTLPVAVSVVILFGMQSAQSGTRFSASPDDSTTIQLQQIADNFAAANLDPSGSQDVSAKVVLTTRGDAFKAAFSGDSDDLDPTVPVYLVQLQGSFIGCTAKTPEPGSVKGAGLIFVFDPESAAVTDWGILEQPIQLDSLGKVTELSLSVSPVPCTEGG